jgi:hypothetical protein
VQEHPKYQRSLQVRRDACSGRSNQEFGPLLGTLEQDHLDLLILLKPVSEVWANHDRRLLLSKAFSTFFPSWQPMLSIVSALWYSLSLASTGTGFI